MKKFKESQIVFSEEYLYKSLHKSFEYMLYKIHFLKTTNLDNPNVQLQQASWTLTFQNLNKMQE